MDDFLDFVGAVLLTMVLMLCAATLAIIVVKFASGLLTLPF